MENEKKKVLQNIAQKEQIAGILWIIVAAIQLMIGIFLNWVVLVIGIWNLIVGISRILASKKIEERKDIVEQYEKSLVSTIIFIVLNVLLGGVIGVIGAIFDLVTRSYVLNNKDIINGTNSYEKVNNGDNSGKYEKLEKLNKLREKGALTEEEFALEKKKILES